MKNTAMPLLIGLAYHLRDDSLRHRLPPAEVAEPEPHETIDLPVIATQLGMGYVNLIEAVLRGALKHNEPMGRRRTKGAEATQVVI